MLLALVLLELFAAPSVAQTPESEGPPPCDAPEAARWVTLIRERLLQFDMLARYGIGLHGPPIACEGEVTTVFDGDEFGVLRLDFEAAWFAIETQPPETSIATLRNPAGFADEDAARRTLEAYCDDIGVDIDWTVAETTVDGDERLVTYSDPEEGLNAMATLICRGETLAGSGSALRCRNLRTPPADARAAGSAAIQLLAPPALGDGRRSAPRRPSVMGADQRCLPASASSRVAAAAPRTNGM